LGLIVREGMAVVALGVGVGVVGALALSRVLTSLVFDVSVRDPLTYVVVAASLAAVALVACVLPARKAARTDPLVALRSE
jgi:ABC-type antimicrobial peptide transport system permease subunit